MNELARIAAAWHLALAEARRQPAARAFDPLLVAYLDGASLGRLAVAPDDRAFAGVYYAAAWRDGAEVILRVA